MNRTCVLVLLIGVFLFVVGCQQQAPSAPTQLTGTQGISISTVSSLPTVYENEEFSISYELVNEGVHPVTREDPGFVFVSHDPLYLEYVGLTSRFAENVFFLDGRSRFFSGEGAFMNLHFYAKAIERFSNQINTQVSATLCYPYASNVTTEVCIEQQQNTDSGEIVCRNAPVSPPTPGAPIGVEEVQVRSGRTTIAGQEVVVPQFRITLRNYGQGIPSTASCISSDSTQLNAAQVSVSLLEEELDCSSVNSDDGFIRFTRDRAVLTCTVFEDSRTQFNTAQGNFLTLLSVDIDYTYRESVRTEVTISR